MSLIEHPILFKCEMVRAILDGKKTQTRRVINFPLNYLHIDRLLGDWPLSEVGKFVDGFLHFKMQTEADDSRWSKVKCPYGTRGDKLWVRETWRPLEGYEDVKPSDIPEGEPIVYLEDCLRHPEKYPICNQPYESKYDCSPWKPSIFMPRWASRIELLIKNIRVERIQNITEEDAIAESVGHGFQMNSGWPDYQHINKSGICEATQDTAIVSFATLWDSINEKRGFEWDVNPWIWVIEWPPLSDNQ